MLLIHEDQQYFVNLKPLIQKTLKTQLKQKQTMFMNGVSNNEF